VRGSITANGKLPQTYISECLVNYLFALQYACCTHIHRNAHTDTDKHSSCKHVLNFWPIIYLHLNTHVACALITYTQKPNGKFPQTYISECLMDHVFVTSIRILHTYTQKRTHRHRQTHTHTRHTDTHTHTQTRTQTDTHTHAHNTQVCYTRLRTAQTR
jgi:hypothetical protein